MSEHTHHVVVSTQLQAGQPVVRLRIGGRGVYNDHLLPLGAAYALGVEIVASVEGLLAGASRPWDGADGRTPFASRSFRRAGARASGPGSPEAARARRRAPVDGYPRPRRIRPDGPVDSGA